MTGWLYAKKEDPVLVVSLTMVSRIPVHLDVTIIAATVLAHLSIVYTCLESFFENMYVELVYIVL